MNQLTSVNGGARIHDADGNLTDNGKHLYEWDAENRLIEVKLKSDNSTIATYAYDYKSRRITKTVDSTETNFVYDGWNPIAEFTGTTLSKTYTWGMDLSGSMQGAGGVGGLLSVNDGSQTYYPTFDGNGNVSEYVDATGSVVAHYEYDTFGQVVASGAKSGDFTHQFSTKQLDSESGLHYYGYRYYDSANGRWTNRDPIGEYGGFNLYGFVGNDGVNYWDYLGQVSCNAQNVGRKIWQASQIVIQKAKPKGRTHTAFPKAIFKWTCKKCSCVSIFGFTYYYKEKVSGGKESIGGAGAVMLDLQMMDENKLIRLAREKMEELKQSCFK